MKYFFFIPVIAGMASVLLLLNCSNTGTENKSASIDSTKVNKEINDNSVAEGENGQKEIIHLTTESFKKEIFDYSKNKQWKFEGKVPAIIDFYADWCRPCKMLAPTLEELQKEYKGKIQIYKVNTDNNPELSQVFGITGIPALLFIPMEGEPQMSTGLLPKETLVTTIADVMKVTK